MTDLTQEAVDLAREAIEHNKTLGKLLSDSNDTLARATDLLIEAVNMLAELQWLENGQTIHAACPECSNISPIGHAKDCKLANLLVKVAGSDKNVRFEK